MHKLNSTQQFRSSNFSHRNTSDKKHKTTEYYYKNNSNFTHHQQVMRDRLIQRNLENYVSGSGDKTTAILLITLIIMGVMIETADAASTSGYDRNHGNLPKNKINPKEQLMHNVCSSTNILPADRPEGWISTRYRQDLMRYEFDIRLPTLKSKEAFIEEYQIRQQNFISQDIRGRVQNTQEYVVENNSRECGKPPESLDADLFNADVELNVVNYIVNYKIFLYKTVEEMYASSNTQVVGNGLEMTIQASLIMLPELKPDEEFFLEINALNTGSGTHYVYGIIVSRDLLMGKGVLGSDTQRKKFIKKFSHPFFYNGKALIEMGKNQSERKANTVLFWKALGIFNGKVKDKAASSQARLCDPYMGYGLYCNGLENCFQDEQIAQTYLMALDTIVEIRVHTWVIPRELKPRINDFVICVNEKINEDIVSIINNKIKPILGINVDTASLDPIKHSTNHHKVTKDTIISNEHFISNACSSTNILPANRVEGWMSTRYNEELMGYEFDIKSPIFKSRETFIKEYEIREQKFIVDKNIRKIAQDNEIYTGEKIYKECGKDTHIPLTNLLNTQIEFNVINYIVHLKIHLYQSIYEIYFNSDAQIIGNCFEMTTQAGLIILPKLKPDEEFFLEIQSIIQTSGVAHSYGIIIPRNLLMGDGITTSNKQKTKFIEKISLPFFDNGNAVINMGETHHERKINTALFWEALGVFNGNIENEDIANQAKLCDPYMGYGLYCNGVQNCFYDKGIAQTYLSALDTITQIRIYTWVIPRELKPKINNFVQLTNDKINEYIMQLVDEKIKPALKNMHEQNLKSEL